MLKVLKKLSVVCLILTMVVGTIGQIVQAEEVQGPDVCADGYCVLDWKTGEVVLSKNKDEKFYPASITKVLTTLVVVENVSDLDETLTFSKYAIESLTERSSTLNPVAQIDEQMTVRQALHGLILSSANECATALAEHVAGSEVAFAKMMNDKAKEVGAVNSNFVNAHGLHNDNHYTTPYDIALIFSAALNNRTAAQILKTVTYTIPATNKTEARSLEMGHNMLNGKETYEGVFAGKTGRTVEAGRTLLTACTKEDTTLVSALMHSEDFKFYSDQKIIFDYAFGQVNGTMPKPFKWVEKEEQVWATGNVTIREYPSTHADSVGVLKINNSLTRLATYGNWSMVQCESGVYYIGSAYLTTVDPNGGTVIDPSESEIPTTSEEVTTEASSEVQSSEIYSEITSSEENSEKNSSESTEESTEENEGNTLSDNDKDDWKQFLEKYWIFILDGVVVFALLIYLIVKLKNKKRNRNRINRNAYKNRRNKW